MATVSTKETREELQWLSDKLSAQVRLIALGMLAVSWGLLVSPPQGVNVSARGLLVVAILALLTMIVDMLQYVVGYANTRRHHRRLIRENIEEGYDPEAPLYRFRIRLFWAKQILVGVAFVPC
jgi:hypothetical protein